MKKSRILLLVLAVALLTGLIIYHLPQRRRVSMPVCNADGEVSTLEIDVKYYRRLFSTPWVEGTVAFDGVVYQDYYADLKTYNVEEIGSNSSFWGWDWDLSPNKNSRPSNMDFIKIISDETKQNWLRNGVNRINFFDVRGNDSFEKVLIIYSDEELTNSSGRISGIPYYGPARTVEEARQIAEEMGYKLG